MCKLSVTGRIVVLNQIIFNLKPLSFAVLDVDANAVSVISVEAGLLVVVVKARGQVFCLSDIDTLVGVSTFQAFIPPRDKIDSTNLIKVGAHPVYVESVLSSRATAESDVWGFCHFSSGYWFGFSQGY